MQVIFYASEYLTEEMVADLVGFTLSEPAILEKLTGQQRNILQKFVDKLVSMFGNEDATAKKEYFDKFGDEFRAIFKDVAREADSIAEQFKAALDTSQKAENKKVPDNSGIRYSKNIDELSIKEQISEHKSELSQMNVVASYNYKGKFKNAKEALNWAISTLKNSGYKVDRQNFGTVILDEKRLKNGLAYLDSEAEYIAYALIPKIIKQGIVIGGHSNHKFRGYPTTTFGAPVSINGIRGNMAVVVRTEGKHYYKLHRVVMPNGGVFEYTEKSSDETAAAASNAVDTPTTTTSTNNYTQKNGNVNRNSRDITESFDSNGKKLTEKQAEYFADSKVREKDGSLKVMYRGDANEITVFDRKKSKPSNLYGRGFYFTDSKSHAEQYGKATEYYLNIENPLMWNQNKITKKQILDFLKVIENDGEDYDLYNYGQDATAESVLDIVWGKGDLEMLQDINATAIGDLVAAIELFNEVCGTNYDGIIVPTETVTFTSEQAKLTSNLNPTKNPDTRYSKELFPDDRTMSAEEIERDEIEQYIQQIKSSDDLSDADVQAIRQEIIQSRKQQREQLLAEIATTNLARWGAELGK